MHEDDEDEDNEHASDGDDIASKGVSRDCDFSTRRSGRGSRGGWRHGSRRVTAEEEELCGDPMEGVALRLMLHEADFRTPRKSPAPGMACCLCLLACFRSRRVCRVAASDWYCVAHAYASCSRSYTRLVVLSF